MTPFRRSPPLLHRCTDCADPPAAIRAVACAALVVTIWLAGCASAQPPVSGPAVSKPPVSAREGTPAPPSASAAATAPQAQVLGLWKIEQARSAPVIHKLNARLDFGADGRLTGSGGCNSLASSYTLAGTRLELGPVIATRKHCGEVLMEQEDRVITALERAVGAQVPPHGLLELSDENGTVLLRATRLPAQVHK